MNPLNSLRKSLEKSILSNRMKAIIRNTLLNIPLNLVDVTLSEYDESDSYIVVKLYSSNDRRIPINITFSDSVDLYFMSASVFEMQEVNTDEQVDFVCSIINMWLSSRIQVTEIKRGDYISKTIYEGSHNYMQSRKMFTRTTLFGRFGKRKMSALYEPWIDLKTTAASPAI
ncbi:MAG: hypothetical protein V3V00_07150 [Saprospiraceae bacterium]